MGGDRGMLEPTLDFIKAVNAEFDLQPSRVIDIGSREQKDRSGARDLFPLSQYLGVDIKDGPNVDVVADAYNLDHRFHPGRFDAALCLHLLEHIARPWLVMKQVDYVLADLGLLYVSVPTIGFPVHNHPGDYWRPTEQAVREVIMDGYEVLSLEHARSPRGKHPFINCLGRKL
jgi:SAM-dependent methyltransferase